MSNVAPEVADCAKKMLGSKLSVAAFGDIHAVPPSVPSRLDEDRGMCVCVRMACVYMCVRYACVRMACVCVSRAKKKHQVSLRPFMAVPRAGVMIMWDSVCGGCALWCGRCEQEEWRNEYDKWS